jgi:hypothetical protein
MIATANENNPIALRTSQVWLETALIFMLFGIQAAWPVPEVNEAHYLSKAKHYWNTSWCQQDFFCNSADAHQAFYWSLGWLTLWLPLPAVAWIGRIVTWAGLAWAWQRLSTAIVPVRFAAVLSAGWFAMLLYRAHMAGEWVVGGVEAKGFAFIFGLLGITAVVRDQWNRAWIWLGIASAFHVLVGGWLVVAAAFAWLVMRFTTPNRPTNCSFLALAAGGAISLLGLVPAVMLMRGVDPATAQEATQIYVFQRLPHHLVPQSFPWYFLLRFVGMILVWTHLAWRYRNTVRKRRLIAIVNGALAIATIGLALNFLGPLAPETTPKLLRYYFFRTSDIMLPLGLALLGMTWITDRLAAQRRYATVLLFAAVALAAANFADILYHRGMSPVAPANRKNLSQQDWIDACRWLAENTPEEAIFLTPRLHCTFRWYANRAEVVNWKDVPQDAVGIVEWWQRIIDVHQRTQDSNGVRFYPSLTEIPVEHLVHVARKYGATYLIAEAYPPLPFELVGPINPSYAIYKVPSEWQPLQPRTE